jgi:predicted GTPase
MEEYEPYVERGAVIFSGVDYEKILRQAEKEADVIIWDGGNNDLPFYKTDFHIVIADAKRPGHEISYYPGETNVRLADLILINKVKTAKKSDIRLIEKNIKKINPKTRVIKSDMTISAGKPANLRNKKVLAIDDGPTITHGGLSYGAAYMFAKQKGAVLIDPRPYAKGSIKKDFEKYKHIANVLPALGYSAGQMKELEQTINSVPCDVVVIGTPVDLNRFLKIKKPGMRIKYVFDSPQKLEPEIRKFLRSLK